MAKINYNSMFVIPDSKRIGSYMAVLPTVWSEKRIYNKYFGKQHYRYPKLAAERYVVAFLQDYYGEVRATYIRAIPHFVEKMKFGAQVNIHKGLHTSRGRKYKKIVVSWTEYIPTGKMHRYKSKRRQTNWLYNDDNQVEREHKATLFAAEKRAELTFSVLHPSALSFEYDLSA